MDRLVRFSLFGQEFSFYTDAPEQEVDSIVSFVRSELEADIQPGPSCMPSHKILVLGCLRIAAKHMALEKEFKEFRKEQDLSIDKLITKVTSGME